MRYVIKHIPNVRKYDNIPIHIPPDVWKWKNVIVLDPYRITQNGNRVAIGQYLPFPGHTKLAEDRSKHGIQYIRDNRLLKCVDDMILESVNCFQVALISQGGLVIF